MEVKLKPGYYVPRPDNPCIGSEFETKGFISMYLSFGGVKVKWDNGTSNVYRDFELTDIGAELVKLNYKSIW